jgi:hypothetical protein
MVDRRDLLMPASSPSRLSRVRWRLAGAWKKAGAGRDHGQTTTEWLMIAGILTAVGIFLLGIVPSTIRYYALSLVYSVRTIAP